MITYFKKYIKSIIREVIEEIIEEQKKEKNVVNASVNRVIKGDIFNYTSFKRFADIIGKIDNCTMYLSLKLVTPLGSDVSFKYPCSESSNITSFMTSLSSFISNFEEITENFEFISEPYIHYGGQYKGYVETHCLKLNNSFHSSIKSEDCLYLLKTFRDSIVKEIPEIII